MVSLAIAEDTADPSLRGVEHQDKVISVAQCVCPPLRFVELEDVSFPHAHGIRAYIETKGGRKRFVVNSRLHEGHGREYLLLLRLTGWKRNYQARRACATSGGPQNS